MRPDRPGPADVPCRGPLDDLRERLARLPASHPSSSEYGFRGQPGQPGTPADQQGALPDGEGALPDEDDALPDEDDALPDEEGAPSAGERDVDGERPGPDGPAGPGRSGRPAWLVKRARPGVPGAAATPGRGEPYRPWFSSGESPQPWFSADPRDRSG